MLGVLCSRVPAREALRGLACVSPPRRWDLGLLGGFSCRPMAGQQPGVARLASGPRRARGGALASALLAS
jgi:hypothetical protein